MATKVEHPTLEERRARGLEARTRAMTDSHAGWKPAADRPDPVALIEEQNLRRDADLVPVRHGRMMASPFTFYRGAAKIMAADLAETPTAGLQVQLCGDAHLSNFGVFASPERNLVFDINDFDETLPGPFEYDVKRLAASLMVAAQNNGCSESDARAITKASVTSYRETMAEFAAIKTLDVWYAHLAEDQIRQSVAAFLSGADGKGKDKDKGSKKGKSKGSGEQDSMSGMTPKQAKEAQKRFAKNAQKAHSRNSDQALSKLGEEVDGRYRIASVPPVIVPARELHTTYGVQPEELEEVVFSLFRDYRSTLRLDLRRLLERFEVVDWARKVVGVGSVGTRAFVVLLQGRDGGDPLFLQVKEATRSVLEGTLRKSAFKQPGERVVQGQRLMQASSDIFLGWSKGVQADRYFYWRQLRDMKGSALVELLAPAELAFYGRTCGWTLARAHARSGDAVSIAAYLGEDDAFDKSITDFSERYAAQNDQDFADFAKAISSNRIAAIQDI
ncbi:uncharacterized protein DUF2252 [Kribbella orskensis]|uniref:Uncharacterized protein DUF2252 n=1 Tax=Kribbella orskensis TaxID=2512216 RepID=A0ABY2B971_9ACTN|nr:MULTISPECIES: DUF2252 domain-containing protein [Kribbella]TCN31688.1 uncharacterized protein DUF2252 [Kribbella sp. VKM Ac-2500]TCO12306.1 uncharacterized protein DUF2252 [Kribbella orskensis]